MANQRINKAVVAAGLAGLVMLSFRCVRLAVLVPLLSGFLKNKTTGDEIRK